MKNKEKQRPNKRAYTKPQLDTIKLDNEISVFMVSPPGDPTFNGSLKAENFNFDPFKFSKLQ